MIRLRRFFCRLKTRSVLRSEKRHDKKVTASGPARGMIRSYLLNQAITVWVLGFRIFDVLDAFFARF